MPRIPKASVSSALSGVFVLEEQHSLQGTRLAWRRFTSDAQTEIDLPPAPNEGTVLPLAGGALWWPTPGGPMCARADVCPGAPVEVFYLPAGAGRPQPLGRATYAVRATTPHEVWLVTVKKAYARYSSATRTTARLTPLDGAPPSPWVGFPVGFFPYGATGPGFVLRRTIPRLPRYAYWTPNRPRQIRPLGDVLASSAQGWASVGNCTDRCPIAFTRPTVGAACTARILAPIGELAIAPDGAELAATTATAPLGDFTTAITTWVCAKQRAGPLTAVLADGQQHQAHVQWISDTFLAELSPNGVTVFRGMKSIGSIALAANAAPYAVIAQ